MSMNPSPVGIDAVTFMRTTRAGERYEIVLDAQDVPLYQSHHWQRTHQGVDSLRRGKRKARGPCSCTARSWASALNCTCSNATAISSIAAGKIWSSSPLRSSATGSASPRKPYFNRRSRTGALVGVTTQKHVHRWVNGNTSTYRCANACFSHQGKVLHQAVFLLKYGGSMKPIAEGWNGALR